MAKSNSEEKNPGAGHRQRLRSRFYNSGLSSLLDYEKLELLLTYAIPRKDVKPLAKLLLERFGSLAQVLDASREELAEVDGIGDHAAGMLRVIRELCNSYLEQKTLNADVVASPEAVINFARMKLGGAKRESFMVMYLNSQNHVLDYEISEGTVDRSVVYPRNLVESCFRLGAVAVIMLHNHPSGVCVPSNEDLHLTRSVQSTLKAVNIRLLDHLIVSSVSFYSLARHGILDE